MRAKSSTAYKPSRSGLDFEHALTTQCQYFMNGRNVTVDRFPFTHAIPYDNANNAFVDYTLLT